MWLSLVACDPSPAVVGVPSPALDEADLDTDADADADGDTDADTDSPAPPAESPSAGCGAPAALRSGERAIGERTFLLELPASYDDLVPQGLILDLHGTGGTANLQKLTSRLGGAGGDAGYVVAWPESNGSGPLKAFDLGCGSPDAQYLADLVDLLGEELCLDLDRVYATGLSNGAYASNLVAGALGERIRGIAPVAGGLGFMPFGCPAERAMPVLVIHSADDGVVPVLEGQLARDWWFERNGCASYTDPDAEGCIDAVGCEAPLRYCELGGIGHLGYYRQWPTTDAIVSFFEGEPTR